MERSRTRLKSIIGGSFFLGLGLTVAAGCGSNDESVFPGGDGTSSSGFSSSGSSDGVGYAVPISKVISVADDLENNVTSSRYDYGYPAFLGVGLGQSGTTVQGVYQGTPAAKAGIAAGDTITAVDGNKVSTAKGLHALIATHSIGGSAAVTWTDQSGASHTATVTLVQGAVE